MARKRVKRYRSTVSGITIRRCFPRHTFSKQEREEIRQGLEREHKRIQELYKLYEAIEKQHPQFRVKKHIPENILWKGLKTPSHMRQDKPLTIQDVWEKADIETRINILVLMYRGSK